jgi:hypothetical protein
VSELRSYLKEKLPEYMVPGAYVVLDKLPLTPNGKVDRRVLPGPRGERPELEQAFIRPRNQFEEMVAEVWVEVLRIDRVGIYDNFFDVGGHSLLLAEVQAKLVAKTGRKLSLIDMFRFPTIDSLSARMAHKGPMPGVVSTADRLVTLEEGAQRRISLLKRRQAAFAGVTS